MRLRQRMRQQNDPLTWRTALRVAVVVLALVPVLAVSACLQLRDSSSAIKRLIEAEYPPTEWLVTGRAMSPNPGCSGGETSLGPRRDYACTIRSRTVPGFSLGFGATDPLGSPPDLILDNIKGSLARLADFVDLTEDQKKSFMLFYPPLFPGRPLVVFHKTTGWSPEFIQQYGAWVHSMYAVVPQQTLLVSQIGPRSTLVRYDPESRDWSLVRR